MNQSILFVNSVFILTLMFSLGVQPAFASDEPQILDNRLANKSQQSDITAQGKILFNQICASCHAKDLSGASGFNLKDGEWVHGSQPSQILHNVKTGFMNAGMPGFGAVFNEEQLESIVAYVMSKREGWDKLSYRLYQLNDENDTDITAEKLIKTGELPKGLADFSIPEVQHYFIEFEGDFYAPKELDTQIWLQWGFPHEVSMYIDKTRVEKEGTAWFPTWPVKRGKQHLRITYRAGKTKPNQRNLVLIGTNLDMTIKLYAVSSKAKGILEGKKFEVKATDKILVQRKRINGLPPSTVSVGLPVKLNYGFNTKSCAVVGLWQGDMLNIGPNIAGRGEDPSLPLGKMIFKEPQFISHSREPEKCVYKGYELDKGNPVFSYQLGAHDYSLTVQPSGSDALTFVYTLKDQESIKLSLPESDKISWSTSGQMLTHGHIELMSGKKAQVSVTATIKP